MLSKPSAGVVLFGSRRFSALKIGSKGKNYDAVTGAFAESFLKRLDGFSETSFSGIVYDREDAEKAAGFFHSRKVDCIICVFASWCEDSAWIAFLREIYDVPLLLYLSVAPGPEYRDTSNEDDFMDFLSRGGLVGTLEASGSIRRLGKSVQTAAGDFDSSEKRIRAFVRAAGARSSLRKAKFGMVPNYNELMRSTYIDPYNMFARVGPELTFISCAALKKFVDSTGSGEAGEYAEELARLYHVDDDVDRALFLESARASIALAALRKEFNLDALILNDVDHELLETLGLRPGFYHPSFNENGAVLVPEGDAGAAVIMYALKAMTGKHIRFAEPFYVYGGGEKFSAGHAGLQDYNGEKRGGLVRISKDARFAKSSFKYAGAPFAWYRIPPGPVTFAHFSESNGKFKVVCFAAESLEGAHQLSGYSHSDFKAEENAAGLFRNIIETGSTQHFAVVEGDAGEELAMFAAINKFEYYRY